MYVKVKRQLELLGVQHQRNLKIYLTTQHNLV
jgi:hypothetical protein